jgi:CRISPR-associated endonuclease/helicase Cas3
LDEIDSYDPKALVAVMRLVTAAAMFGRHVVASSATLSVPVAAALYDAYQLGADMGERAGLRTTGRWRQAVIDDKSGAHLQIASDAAEFKDWFKQTLKQILDGMGYLSYRPAELIEVVLQGDRPGRREGVQSAIAQGVQRMHERHRWAVTHQGVEHRISLGLVRIANIRNAVLVAKRLAALRHVRVCCYHAQLSRIHRYLLERNLDQILTRHPSPDRDPGQRLLENKEVRAAVERSQARGEMETILIVVATPVEEIGRDHDFDWALIEPSSTQAIVQSAGRINRHRLAPTASPNVGILQFNFLEADQNPRDAAVFQRPGLEISGDEGSTHPSHDLKEILKWQRLLEAGQVDMTTTPVLSKSVNMLRGS